jgi:hypothetical protein
MYAIHSQRDATVVIGDICRRLEALRSISQRLRPEHRYLIADLDRAVTRLDGIVYQLKSNGQISDWEPVREPAINALSAVS